MAEWLPTISKYCCGLQKQNLDLISCLKLIIIFTVYNSAIKYQYRIRLIDNDSHHNDCLFGEEIFSKSMMKSRLYFLSFIKA